MAYDAIVVENLISKLHCLVQVVLFVSCTRQINKSGVGLVEVY